MAMPEMDDSDIFNDVLEGGGVDPSIDESIRDSIKCSFVSSEYGMDDDGRRHQNDTESSIKDNYVMNRMNWISYLKVLFDQLESFNQNKQKHVENGNFIKALKKIKDLLPLQSRNDYYKNCSDVAFTYKQVEQGVTQMPKYITWDNVIDIFLSKQFTQIQSSAFQQIDSDDNYPQPSQINESQISEEHADNVHSYGNKGSKFQQPMQAMQGQINEGQKMNKFQRNEDFFLSFADSVIKMTSNTQEPQNTEFQTQQLLAQAPLLRDKDDDEACEIDSDDGDQEESKSNSRRQKSKLEESIRSSRTATFKSVRGTSAHTFTNNTNVSIAHSGTPTTHNAQDSYYVQTTNAKKAIPYAQQQQQVYFTQPQQQQYITVNKHDLLDGEDGQVEVGSNHSRASSRKGAIASIVEVCQTYEDQIQAEKSTRLSSLNSMLKNQNHNSTILSNSSQSSKQSQNKKGNASKVSMSSGHQSNSALNSSSNFVDIDHQSQGFKNYEIDFKQAYGPQKILRSINLSLNSLTKFPPNLEKTLQYMNISFNKLKSLNGIENCINLKFLNVQGNQIASASSIIQLQSLRELIFSGNQLSMVKDIAQLKNLQLLDLSYNKIIEFEKIIPLQALKKIQILSLQGNKIQTITNYESVIRKMLPLVKALDPDQIKDFSQFQEMEHICFTEAPFIMVEQQSQLNLVKKEVLTENRVQERSKTPNRERARSQIGGQQAPKSQLISPRKTTEKMEYNVVSRNLPQQQYSSHASQNDNKQRLSSKSQTKGNATSRPREIQNLSAAKDKSQTRERSVSNNISRNNNLKTNASQGVPVNAPLNKVVKQHTQPMQHAKDAMIKKVNVNMMANGAALQTKSTPKRSNVVTPRQEKPTHYYKRSFCKTEEEPSITLDTPSDKNTVRTAPTQESSHKKPLRQINKNDNVLSPLQNKANPMYQTVISNAPQNSNRQQRPVTNLKQRPSTTQKDDTQEFPNLNHTMHPPQSTKNIANYSQSFVFETGRSTPSHQSHVNSRSSSKLQQFINASKNSSRQSAQTPMMMQPSQKVTNLPPKIYQSRAEKPGDKKSKADMSSSRISSQQQMNVSKLGTGMNTSVVQTGGNEEVSRISESMQSDRSMSPVCDESNNIKKLKVDLTQYMNKQQ